MSRMNRDTLVAIVILLMMAFVFAATFTIPDPNYDSMKPGVWPRVVIGFTGFWAVVYLVQALADTGAPRVGTRGGLRTFFSKYRNPLVSFLLFGVFVAVLPYLGILIAGSLFVFSVLSFIGSRRVPMLVLHGVISIVTVVGLWAIFTFLLGVMLPEGNILRLF